MTWEPDFVFHEDMCFYPMVSVALASLSVYPVLFRSDNWANLKPKDHTILPGFACDDRKFVPYDVYEDVKAGHISTDDFLGTVCMMLVNTAYESVRKRNDGSPEFEFFRHVRNASSHLNHFHFSKKEPRRPASWRGIVIDHTLKGDANPLQHDGCFGKMLGVADALTLLWDIEQILISLGT